MKQLITGLASFVLLMNLYSCGNHNNGHDPMVDTTGMTVAPPASNETTAPVDTGRTNMPAIDSTTNGGR